MPETWTLKKMIEWGSAYFSKHAVESPRLNIEHLLAALLKKKRIELYVDHERQLKPDELATLKEMIQRRVKGEPLQYILGETEFYSSVIKVNPSVLIPRPETELLVERVLQEVAARFANIAPLRLFDLGTGSGNIALTLAQELPQAEIYAVDISAPALAAAHENAQRLGLAERLQFLCGDWFDPLAALAHPQAHVIICNPPYVAASEFDALPREIRDHEPRAALVAGTTGLEMYEKIIPQAPRHLLPGGLLAFELGKGQAPAVQKLLQAHGFVDVSITKDYSGIERIITGIRV